MQLYTYTCGNIFNTIKTSGHSSLEKYTSHFIRKGCVWEVSWRPNKDCNILTPTLQAIAAFLFCSPGLLNRGPGGLGAQPLLRHSSHSSFFSPTDLDFLSPELYNNLTSTYFLRASQIALNSTLCQSRLSPDIFDRMHLLFTLVHFFFWQLSWGQYTTHRLQENTPMIYTYRGESS